MGRIASITNSSNFVVPGIQVAENRIIKNENHDA